MTETTRTHEIDQPMSAPDRRACCDHAEDRARSPADPDALISARGLKIVRGGRRLIDDIDFDIRRGEIVTLIGPNGAGKTTLVRALMGLEPCDGGVVAKRETTRIGYVPQKFDIDKALPMTASRFLSLGLDAGPDEISASLREVGAGRIGAQQMSALSGGELQRLLMARALLRAPNLLVLDEPVRGVDYAGEAELYSLISRLRDERNLGVLMVSHDLHVVMAASDRVVCLNQHICCSGAPTTVSEHPEYQRLFGAQAAKAFAVYEHHHDHRHDLGGAPIADDSDVENGTATRSADEDSAT